ncbi:hypothetical protein ACFFK0_17020 [Paenibacillus chartarius]|uniref:Uncharacterized protein n=1 Tax=Paenibacillus chartarius TaxID=747481 RepID=A0ABV6DNC8_9BACL
MILFQKSSVLSSILFMLCEKAELRRYEVDCYNICYYLLKNDSAAAKAACQTLLDLYVDESFWRAAERSSSGSGFAPCRHPKSSTTLDRLKQGLRDEIINRTSENRREEMEQASVMNKREKIETIFVWAVFICYTLFLFKLLFLSRVSLLDLLNSQRTLVRSVNLIPFYSIKEYIFSSSVTIKNFEYQVSSAKVMM